MVSKKVIEQEENPNVIISHQNDEVIIKENVSWQEPVIIEKSKAMEVALAICPELGIGNKHVKTINSLYEWALKNGLNKEGNISLDIRSLLRKINNE